jgi:hypothetical protein
MKAKRSSGPRFVYVKTPQNDLNRANKIPLPATIDELIPSAARRLKLRGTITGIYDEEGSEIVDISSVRSGSVLTIVSSRRGSKVPSVASRTDSEGGHSTKLPSRHSTRHPSEASESRQAGDPSYDDDELAADIAESALQEPPPECSQASISIPATDPAASEAAPNPIDQLFQRALSPESLTVDFDSLTARIPKPSFTLLQNAFATEQEQQKFWYSNLSDVARRLGLLADVPGIVGLDSMKAVATELLQQHIVPGQLGYSTVLQLVIAGPARSGKTTFFGLFLEQLMLGLIACGLWKKTCLILLNGDHIAASAGDPTSLHVKIVELTIASIVAQAPILTAHAKTLRKFFERVVDQNLIPILPKRFIEAPETQAFAKSCLELADRLKSLWNDPECGGPWASLLFRFPLLLAHELGFEDVIFAIDNFDSLNIVLHPDLQFESGDIQISECMKGALKHGQFVLSCHDDHDFDQCVVSLDDNTLDIGGELEYYSTLDLGCETDYAEHVVTVDIGSESFTVTANHFGGAPGYVKQWNVLNEMLDNMELVHDDQEAVEDFLSEAMTQASLILPLIFQSERGFGEVDDVRRRKANE